MFCINCDQRQSYTKHYRQAEVKLFMEVPYEEEFAICDGCGEEVYVPAVNDRNCAERERVYRLACEQAIKRNLGNSF